jgi:uncharacterized protein YbjT (DUF2867 family)
MSVLTIFGASGGTGRALTEEALSRHHRVRAFVRRGGSALDRVGVDEIVGALADTDAVARAVAGADAVCCVFGPRPPFTEVFCEAATEVIVAAMRPSGCSRLVCQTGAMVGPYPGNRTRIFELMSCVYWRRSPAAMADRDGQERVVRGSGLAWTLVKPPRLTDSTKRGDLKAGPDVKVGLLSSVSRGSLARFIMDAIESEAWKGQTVFVKE